ncbi:PREDICTED: uncharacterized protein LOC108746652 [Trachymyrmex septentrionalis]|uniref:uncharacterized protein LOC108746652 n=1 Tax=Trachymyrmex septentrionalis TaxID=34720 RepID=UPI00084F23E1|nr:PREDICTED: uncharacterized protein LOC108746652 [Trachymyrmex septentrionalis]
MENVCNRIDVLKLLTQWEGRYGAEAMIAKSNFHTRSVFSENLVAIELRKLEVKFDKSIYVDMCILDIFKTCTICTNFIIKCDDVYDISRFDKSDYSSDNAYGIPLAIKKVPGFIKDDNNGVIMIEFVGLRVKMYALPVEGKKDTKKAKGIKSNVVVRSTTFEYYTWDLNDAIELTHRQSCIRSKLYEVYTISETKIALSPHTISSILFQVPSTRCHGGIM